VSGAPLRFTYQALPMRVLFRPGALAALAGELDALGLRRVLVLSTPGQEATARVVARTLGDRAAGIHPHAVMHVPVEVARRARDAAGAAGADGCVAVGGGSTIGLGKAVALQHGLPVVAVPTTYAGSEMTPIWGLTEQGAKRTGRDPRVLPRSVVYDPELTLSLPARVSAASGLNAVAHAVEALYAPDASPIVSLMAEEGVRAFSAALPAIARAPRDLAARGTALYGAWLCGACLGATTMSLHHKLCHILGGTLDLPHAETHAVVLPYVLAYNAGSAPAAVAALRRALDTDDPALALQELGGRLGTPRSLGELGVRAEDLDRVVEQGVASPSANPREFTREDLRALLEAALDGRPVTPAA
jgi:maleylacetate reductase